MTKKIKILLKNDGAGKVNIFPSLFSHLGFTSLWSFLTVDFLFCRSSLIFVHPSSGKADKTTNQSLNPQKLECTYIVM